MCGRARLSSDVSEIKLVFTIPPERPSPNIPANWNAAPTEALPVVRYDAKAGQRGLDVMRWGLVPFWAKDIKVGFANINAKAEGIETKPAFRGPSRGGAASSRSTASTNGRRSARTGSLMPSGSPIGGLWRWPACGKPGARRPVRGCVALR
jgi:hypothetical protein